MTVAALTELFLMDMGYARSDTAEPDVVEEYAGVLLRWLNEGYARAVRRIHGRAGIEACAARCRSRKKEPFRCAIFVLYSFCGCKRIGAQRCRDARRTRQDPRSRRRNEIETEK